MSTGSGPGGSPQTPPQNRPLYGRQPPDLQDRQVDVVRYVPISPLVSSEHVQR